MFEDICSRIFAFFVALSLRSSATDLLSMGMGVDAFLPMSMGTFPLEPLDSSISGEDGSNGKFDWYTFNIVLLRAARWAREIMGVRWCVWGKRSVIVKEMRGQGGSLLRHGGIVLGFGFFRPLARLPSVFKTALRGPLSTLTGLTLPTCGGAQLFFTIVRREKIKFIIEAKPDRRT